MHLDHQPERDQTRQMDVRSRKCSMDVRSRKFNLKANGCEIQEIFLRHVRSRKFSSDMCSICAL